MHELYLKGQDMAWRTFRDVYSEDNNFLIGEDFMTDRLRREARQLHLSKFKTTRREAHFARYRNSFLKCDLERTNDRIEQERQLRSAEMERERAVFVKQAERRRKIVPRKLSDNNSKTAFATTEKLGSMDAPDEGDGAKSLQNHSQIVRQSNQGFRQSIISQSASRASSFEGKRDLGKEIEQTAAINGRLEVRSVMSIENEKSIFNHEGTVDEETNSDQINNSENAESEKKGGSEKENPPVLPGPESGSEQNLTITSARSPTPKTRNARASLLNRRKSSSAKLPPAVTVKKIKTKSAHERWIWGEFDKIMKGFADFLQIEHVRVNMKQEAAMEKDVRTKPAQKISLNSMQTLSPLFFRYGVSDQIAFRF